MDMRYLIPTLIALCAVVFRFGGAPLAHLTMTMAEHAAYHQQHMMSLSKLNHALTRGQHHSPSQ
jgi:hypothetical protein